MTIPSPLEAFARRWGLAPASKRLQTALTHTSAARTVSESSERLEFLGDALLSAWVARYLYDTLPPETSEDTLSRAREQVVRRETLAQAGRAIGLPDLLKVGHGEQKERRFSHDSLVGDAFEAVAAALYLEAGPEAFDAFLRETLWEMLSSVVASPPTPNAKTALQEQMQQSGRGLPLYVTVAAEEVGNTHRFLVEAQDKNGGFLGRGEGPSKRIAQMNAAREALKHLQH